MTKFEQVEAFIEANAEAFSDPYKLGRAAAEKFGVGVYVDAATPERSLLPGIAGRRQRSHHAMQVWYLRSGKYSRAAGWVYIRAASLKAAE